MATIVGGALVPHDPLIFTAPEAAPEAERQAVHDAYAAVAEQLGRLAADACIIIGADHYILFGPGCLPPYLVAIGDVDGPLERLPGLDRKPIPVAHDLAQHLVRSGPHAGFDWAVARTLTADHSVAIPQRLVAEPAGIPRTVPVYLNCGVDPYLPMGRARALGEHLRAAVGSWDADARVAVIGSGGISHWVGTAEMGRVDEGFDRWVLDCVASGDIDTLAGLDDEEIMAGGGNGALELRTFVAAMAATGAAGGEVVGYVPAPDWITGLGFAVLDAAHHGEAATVPRHQTAVTA